MDKKEQQRLSRGYMAGEPIPGVKFRHNSKVKVHVGKRSMKVGWIVAVDVSQVEPIYTIELEDRGPDLEARESTLQLIHDPHI